VASFPGVLSKNPLKYFWPLAAITPGTYHTAQTSASIDRYRNGGYAALTLMLNPGTWTDGNHSWAINESDDNSTWTAVAAADLLPGPEVGVYGTASTFVAINAASTTIQRIDYIGRKRYVQVVSTESGATGLAYSLVAMLFAPAIYPAA